MTRVPQKSGVQGDKNWRNGRQISPAESMARDISSDDPSDWAQMSEPQRDYWRRIAGRVFVHLARLKKAQADLDDFRDGGAAAA